MSVPLSHTTTELPTPFSTKQEVKIEAEDPVRPAQTPSSLFMKDPLSFSQSTFNKVLLECLASTFQPPVKTATPQLTRFPVLIQDPFTLRAFAHFKVGFGEFLKDTLLNNPYRQDPPPYHKKVAKKPNTAAHPIVVKDSVVVKKEDNGEESNSKPTEEEKPAVPLKKVPKKKAQNRIKNIPGLIMQRVRSSIKTYFTRNPRFEKQERRLTYVEKVLGCLSKQEKEKILAFLDQYQKNWKTWNTIQKYLQTDSKCGTILLDVVLEFFGNDGLEDFNDWLTSGKMGDKSKAAVTEMKDRIGQKFSKILVNTGDEEEINLGLKDKLVKKEEKAVKKEEI